MSIVTFELDKEKDAWNNWKTANYKTRFCDVSKLVPETIADISKGKEFSECKKGILNFLVKMHGSASLAESIKTFQGTWDSIEQDYFFRLEKITSRPVLFNSVKAYLTTIGKCPYSPDGKWFMVYYHSDVPRAMAIAGHEILHLHFHKYFWKNVELEIGRGKTEDLKEALTILLDLEFKDLWGVEDRGYEQHKDLRDFIVREWKKEKDFVRLLDKCVGFFGAKYQIPVGRALTSDDLVMAGRAGFFDAVEVGA